MLMLTGLMSENDSCHDRKELEMLLGQTAEGSLAALEELYRRTRAAVYAMSLSYLNSGEEAQDVTQDVFVRVWENAAGYRPQGSPMAWILAIARNLCLMRLRQGRRYATFSEEEWNAVPAEELSVSSEDRIVLQDALAALSEEERRVVLLHAVAGLKHREIARMMQQPLSTILSKYRRALKKMRNRLEGENII